MKRSTSSSSLLRAKKNNSGSLSRLLFESEYACGYGNRDRGIIYRLCQLVVLIIRAITPISYIYLMVLLCVILLPTHIVAAVNNINHYIYSSSSDSYTVMTIESYESLLQSLHQSYTFYFITMWCVLEVIFFPYYLYLFHILDQKQRQLQHFAASDDESKCYLCIHIVCHIQLYTQTYTQTYYRTYS